MQVACSNRNIKPCGALDLQQVAKDNALDSLLYIMTCIQRPLKYSIGCCISDLLSEKMAYKGFWSAFDLTA